MSSIYVDRATPAVEYLESMATLYPQVSTEYTNLSNLFSAKLWHQLTIAMISFLGSKDVDISRHMEFYQKVVQACDSSINPESLAMIASKVADSLVESDNSVACSIFETLLESKKDNLGTGATVYARSKLVLLKLKKIESLGADVPESHSLLRDVSSTLEDCEKKMIVLDGVDGSTSVRSAYYEASKAYRKLVGPPELFFREGMMFLNYTPLDTLHSEELFSLATDLSLAALTGDGVFNFGEVVNDNPILTYLDNTENAWLMSLMQAMSVGDVTKFQEISQRHAQDIQKHVVLVTKANVVQEKITLLALVNMVFERPSSERTLKFEDIAKQICVTQDRVEWVIMRALSLGLMKGSMDQVDGTVTVTWIMPRVLDAEQTKALSIRFGEWAGQVAQEKEYMMQETIFA